MSDPFLVTHLQFSLWETSMLMQRQHWIVWRAPHGTFWSSECQVKRLTEYWLLLSNNQWLNDYLMSLIAIARLPKFQRLWALLYTEYTKNGQDHLAKNKRRIVVWEESIKGYLLSTDYFKTLALTLLCQGGICLEKFSSLKSQVSSSSFKS